MTDKQDKYSSVVKIPESEFSERTRGLENRAITKYLNRYAMAIPVSENEVYVNIKGDCYIVASLSVLDSLLTNKERNGVEGLAPVKIPLIDSNEIRQKVKGFLESLSIGSSKVDDNTILLIEKKIKDMPNRSNLLPNLYFVVGEYFCYAFKSKIIWKHVYDREVNDTVPVLFYSEEDKALFYAKEMSSFLLNGQIGEPLQVSKERIFYLINKK